MEFGNPILPGMHPDPTVCRVGRDFYLACSSFEYFPGVSILAAQEPRDEGGGGGGGEQEDRSKAPSSRC